MQQMWEEESHKLIPTKLHPDHQVNQGEQSTFHQMSGGGPLNSTMMQTMHTMPPGIGGGVISGYGPQSSQHAEARQPMHDHNTYRTSVGFFKQTSRNDVGSTPTGTHNTQAHVPGGPQMDAAVHKMQFVVKNSGSKPYLEQMQDSRKRHSSVARDGVDGAVRSTSFQGSALAPQNQA